MEAGSAGNTSVANRSSLTVFAGTDLLQRYKPFFLLLYCALLVVACAGNAFLIGCIAADRKLHNATNFFIGNLSAADLLMCLSCVPLTVSYAFEPRGWLFGGFMCHLASLLQSTTVYVSVLSLAAIAVDRYMVVAHPIRRRTSRQWFGPATAIIWLVSLSLASPAAVYTRYQEFHPVNFSACGEYWPARDIQRIAYSCTILLLSYMLPLLAVIISYCAVTVHLTRRDGLGEIGRNRTRWGREKGKTFLLLVVSVLTFALSWLPLQLVNLIIDLDMELTILDYRHIKILHLSCHWVAMSSSCYNPFIYASLHRKVRLRLRGYMQSWRGRVDVSNCSVRKNKFDGSQEQRV